VTTNQSDQPRIRIVMGPGTYAAVKDDAGLEWPWVGEEGIACPRCSTVVLFGDDASAFRVAAQIDMHRAECASEGSDG
jgi:hypothetical protein